MNEKKKKPILNFTVFAFAVQVVMWVLFCLYDYGIDEGHWTPKYFSYSAEDVIAYVLMFIILIFPIALYFFNRRRFSSGVPIKDAAIQIPCWCAAAFAISFPIVHMVNNHKWIIAQETGGGGGMINLNGLEYIAIPMINIGFALLLLVKLAVVAAIEVHSRRAK